MPASRQSNQWHQRCELRLFRLQFEFVAVVAEVTLRKWLPRQYSNAADCQMNSKSTNSVIWIKRHSSKSVQLDLLFYKVTDKPLTENLKIFILVCVFNFGPNRSARGSAYVISDTGKVLFVYFFIGLRRLRSKQFVSTQHRVRTSDLNGYVTAFNYLSFKISPRFFFKFLLCRINRATEFAPYSSAPLIPADNNSQINMTNW